MHLIIRFISKVLGSELGLELNLSKCEVFAFGGDTSSRRVALEKVLFVSSAIHVTPKEELSLLGCPLLDDAIEPALAAKTAQVKLLTSRLQLIHPQQALYLRKKCLSIPKLLYVLRCCPAWRFGSGLAIFDEVIRASLSRITNTAMIDEVWRQASLPVSYGGLGIRKTVEIALPAYLASIYSVERVASVIVPTTSWDAVKSEPEESWREAFWL